MKQMRSFSFLSLVGTNFHIGSIGPLIWISSKAWKKGHETCHICWKLMRGKRNALLQWSLFRGHAFFFGGSEFFNPPSGDMKNTNRQNPLCFAEIKWKFPKKSHPWFFHVEIFEK